MAQSARGPVSWLKWRSRVRHARQLAAANAVGTAADYIAWLRLRFGLPYSETLDGGVGPHYFDCSGLTEVGLNAIGIAFTRSTYTQWSTDRARYEHFGPFTFGQWAALMPLLQLGDVLYFHVDGEPDPGHVGIYVGGGQFIEAPHTGAVVGQYPVPNTPGEHVYGVIRPPFANAPAPNPTPAPAPPAPTPPPIYSPGDNVQTLNIPIIVKGGSGWSPSPVNPAKLVGAWVAVENPDLTGGVYSNVPTVIEASATPGPHSPNGVIVLRGLVPDATYVVIATFTD